LRGVEKVRAEWAMICTAHNLLKLFTIAIAARAGYPATNVRHKTYLDGLLGAEMPIFIGISPLVVIGLRPQKPAPRGAVG